MRDIVHKREYDRKRMTKIRKSMPAKVKKRDIKYAFRISAPLPLNAGMIVDWRKYMNGKIIDSGMKIAHSVMETVKITEDVESGKTT